MSTRRAYLDDPFQVEFTAEITGTVTLPDGRRGVVLAETYFYPTGGGQEHDTGTLGAARVTDVFADADDNIVHVVDREIADKRAAARVDRARRFAFMQEHSAQHLLSATVDHLLGLPTVSSKISIDSPTTIDLPTASVSESDVTRAEDLANAVIYEDRPIKTYTISDADVSRVPFRRPPKVTGQIRVVEIDGLDYSACGGTHCTRSGMIGIVKVLKVERRGDKTRLYLVAGERALRVFQDYHAVIIRAAQELDTNPQALAETITRQQALLRAAQKDLQELEILRAEREARELAAQAEPLDGMRVVTAAWRDRSPQQLRALGGELQKQAQLIALLASYDGTKLSLTAACGEGAGVSANDLIRRVLTETGGRGGGDARLAQGGGSMTEEQFKEFGANLQRHVRAARGQG